VVLKGKSDKGAKVLINLVVESKAHPKKRGAYHTLKDGVVSSKKSKVKNYPSIRVALRKGYVGQIFSTKNAARLYVVSNAGWGKKSSGRIAKGFTPGSSTPSSKWASIKGHAVRTMKKHGGQRSEKFKKYKVEK